MLTSARTLITSDGARLNAVTWRPTGTPKAAVVIVHGIAEHCERYRPIATFLAANGYAVQTFDLRGHGRSSGARATVDDFDHYADDAESAVDALRADFGHLPVVLIGHSMGALVALQYGLRAPDKLGGIIASGVPLALADLPGVLRGLAGFLSRTTPNLPLVKLSSAQVCSDARIVKDYDADPQVYRGRLRARVLHELIDHARDIRDHLDHLHLSLLVLHGGADRLVTPAGSQTLYNRAGSVDKTLKIYPGLFHEIFNEPQRDQVFADVVAWLDERFAAS